MTIKVTITHSDLKGQIDVLTVISGMPATPMKHKTLSPGESTELHVWSRQEIIIREVNEAPLY